MDALTGFPSRCLASVARLSAHRPIHVILFTALVTAVAYLSIVDEIINLGALDQSEISYYHPPRSNDYKDWTLIDDISPYSAADHIAITPLIFNKVGDRHIPSVENSFFYADSSEKYFICDFSELDQKINNISQVIADDGTSWKLVHQYRIGTYQQYARKAFDTLRSVISGAETFDIVMVTAAYVAMYYTFFKLFYNLRITTGSKFWLGFASITSSSFAFLLAFATASKLGVKVTLLSLSEGIPFLVSTVGFDRIVKLSASILTAANSDKEYHSISLLIYKHLESTALNFVKDQLLCGFAFLACSIYAFHLEGLKNFCVLSALIMFYDVVLTFSYYSAILALKVEINMIHRSNAFEEALEEDGIPESVAKQASLQSITSQQEHIFDFDSSYVTLFKLGSVAAFFAFHAYLVGSNWIFVSNESTGTATIVRNLSKSVAKHIEIGNAGTVVTILEPKIFVPKTFFFQSQDVVLSFLEKLSSAIRDKFISKTLLFFFGTSAAINVYLLNAARTHSIDKPTQKLNEAIKSKELAAVAQESAQKLAAAQAEAAAAKYKSVGNAFEISDVIRPLEECEKILKEGDVKTLNNEEVALLTANNKIPLYALEKKLGDNHRAVLVRRKAIAQLAKAPIVDTFSVPFEGYDYNKVFGACCENVIGYMPLPLGIAGPLLIDGKPYHIPMATTEGCLVASATRGCKAINAGGGVTSVLTRDGMTRGPCVKFPSLKRAGACKIWLDSDEGQDLLKKDFNSTSRFARLQHVQTAIAGSLLFIRFRTTTGDAMGMNMISKGVEFALQQMVSAHGWSDMEVISVSGNYCTDKKAAAINWTNGRGKSVVAEATIPSSVVEKVLKTTVDALVELNVSKNLVGSAMAGALGGFNAHAANILTAIYLACGQDPAQNVESSNCITLMDNVNGNLVISVSMPCIEVGTIGGGTILEPQAAMLELLGVRGPHPTTPGANAQQLARIIASAVLSAELSLCSALAAGHLVKSHMQHNRGNAGKSTPAPVSAPASTSVATITNCSTSTSHAPGSKYVINKGCS